MRSMRWSSNWRRTSRARAAAAFCQPCSQSASTWGAACSCGAPRGRGAERGGSRRSGAGRGCRARPTGDGRRRARLHRARTGRRLRGRTPRSPPRPGVRGRRSPSRARRSPRRPRRRVRRPAPGPPWRGRPRRARLGRGSPMPTRMSRSPSRGRSSSSAGAPRPSISWRRRRATGAQTAASVSRGRRVIATASASSVQRRWARPSLSARGRACSGSSAPQRCRPPRRAAGEPERVLGAQRHRERGGTGTSLGAGSAWPM
jgi:hypothetical protein